MIPSKAISRLLPLTPLLVGAGVLLARWDSIPARWAIHFDQNGIANGFSEKGALSVFMPILLGVLVLAFVEAVRFASRGWMMRLPGSGHPELLRANDRALVWVETALACVMAYLAVELPLGHSSLSARIGVPLAILAVGTVAAISTAVRASRRLRSAAEADFNDGYHLFYYANRNDPRLWVPKKFGVGWTLNFSHAWAWPMMFLLLSPLWVLAGASMLGSWISHR